MAQPRSGNSFRSLTVCNLIKHFYGAAGTIIKILITLANNNMLVIHKTYSATGER